MTRAIERVVTSDQLRRITPGHLGAYECGAVDAALPAAPASHVAHAQSDFPGTPWSRGQGEASLMNPEIPVPQDAPGSSPAPRIARVADSGPDRDDRSLLRIGAIAGALGVVLQLVTDQLHPAHAHPNDSAAAFAEYARSDIWVSVHIGQFLGTLLIVVALVALARSAARQPGVAGALAVVGTVAAVVVAAVFTVQMAVDGVALKAAVDAWSSAAGPDKPTAFLMADDVRAVEKGLGGFFQMSNGLTLLALGLSLALGRMFRRWLGWVGAIAGVGWFVGGVTTAHTGFSVAASRILMGPLLLTLVFVVGVCVAMWRTSTTAD
jgi:hypothetical protein